MDPSTQGTGAIVLAKIDAVLNLLSGASWLPYSGNSGLFVLPASAGRVDVVNQFLILEWAPPASGPADFPLLLRFKSDSSTQTEFGYGWSVPFQRFAEIQGGQGAAVIVRAPVSTYDYDPTPGPDYTTVPPGTNSLVGSTTTGWTETQPDNTAFNYDTFGVLQSIQNPAGVRWTLTWNGGFASVDYITGPFGRRTSFAYDANNMIRRIQDPGGRISTFSCNANGLLRRAVTPELCITSFLYGAQTSVDSGYCLAAKIDPLGNRTTYTYTIPPIEGYIKAVQLPMGQRITFLSDASPPSTTIIDPRGGRWTVTSDSMSVSVR
jgi:hypothetical protein